MKLDYNEIENNLLTLVMEKYYSKKNSVYLINYNEYKIIAKVFNTSKHQFEFEVLNTLYKKSIPVPEPYSLVNQTIFMEYLKGETLMDIINSNLPNKEKYLESLSDFFSSIHNIKKEKMSLLKGDSSIRNFIYSTKIYGLDFEESSYGNPMKDIGGVIAQILDSSPSFNDEKFYFSNYLLEKYLEKKYLYFSQIKLDFKEYLIKSLLFDASFRPNQRDEILKWVSRIKKDFDQIFDIQSQ